MKRFTGKVALVTGSTRGIGATGSVVDHDQSVIGGGPQPAPSPEETPR